MTLKKYQHTVTDASCHFWWRTSCEKGRLSDQFPSKFNISTLNILPGGRLHHSLFALLRLITMEKPYRHSDLIKRTCSYYKSGTVIGNSCFQVRTKLGKWQWEEDMLSLPEWEQNSGKNSNDGEAAKGGNSRHFPSDKLHLGGILLWPFPGRLITTVINFPGLSPYFYSSGSVCETFYSSRSQNTLLDAASVRLILRWDISLH